MIFIHRNIQLPYSLPMNYNYKPQHKWTFSYHKIGQYIAPSPKRILNIRPTNELKSLITKQTPAKVGKLAITNKVGIVVNKNPFRYPLESRHHLVTKKQSLRDSTKIGQRSQISFVWPITTSQKITDKADDLKAVVL